MAFDGTESNPISEENAAAWTRNHRAANPEHTQSHFFGRDMLLKILKQEECQGIRFYYGLNEDGPLLLAVGVDGHEDDQLGKTRLIADEAPKGPPRSGQASILNS